MFLPLLALDALGARRVSGPGVGVVGKHCRRILAIVEFAGIVGLTECRVVLMTRAGIVKMGSHVLRQLKHHRSGEKMPRSSLPTEHGLIFTQSCNNVKG